MWGDSRLRFAGHIPDPVTLTHPYPPGYDAACGCMRRRSSQAVLLGRSRNSADTGLMGKPPNWFWAGLLLVAVVGTLLTAYHFAAERRRAEIDAQHRVAVEAYEVIDGLAREDRLSACLDAAQKDYESRWTKTCHARGDLLDCQLPGDIARDYSDDRDEQQDRCVQRYGRKR